MREITFDLTADSYLPQSGFGGFEGEHNATRLTMLLPPRLVAEDAVYYMIFEVMKNSELVFSAPLEAENGSISAALPKQVMLSPEIRVYAAAYRRDGEALVEIAKSARVVLEIRDPEEGKVAEYSEGGGEIPGLVIESRITSDSKNPVSSSAIHEELSSLKQGEVISACVDTTGELILKKRDSSTLNAGYVVGPQGEKGEQGGKGEQGPQGERGEVDYSLVAGALKGSVSGEKALVLSDVSSLSHEMGVKLKSKNLFEYPYPDTTVTRYGITFTDNGDGTVTASGTATSDSRFRIQGLAGAFEVKSPEGATYFLSGCPEGGSESSFYIQVNIQQVDYAAEAYDTGTGAAMTLKEGLAMWMGCYITIKEGTTVENLVFKPQIEPGTKATAFTKWIDVTGVTLTKYGKNLFDDDKDYGSSITVLEENGEKVFTNVSYQIEGENREYVGFNITDIWQLAYDRGVNLKISFDIKAAKEGQVRVYTLGNYSLLYNKFHNVTTEWQRFSFTASAYVVENGTMRDRCDLSFYGEYQSGVVPFVKNIQIEWGTMETEFEQIQMQTYTPEADGTVKGVTSLFPITTLLCDADGVTIEAEYNKDINKVIESLVDAIISLGGNV